MSDDPNPPDTQRIAAESAAVIRSILDSSDPPSTHAEELQFAYVAGVLSALDAIASGGLLSERD